MALSDILAQMRSQENEDQLALPLKRLEDVIVGAGCKREEILFDFFMEDGIRIVVEAMQKKSCFQINDRMFKFLFHVAEDNPCHWQCIWESIGKLDGLTSFLEKHHCNENIVARVIYLCWNCSRFRLLHVEAKDVLRWMAFWDVLLCSVESFMDRCDIFTSFCQFLDGLKGAFIPAEMRTRISFSLLRGFEILERQESGPSDDLITIRSLLVTSFVLNDENEYLLFDSPHGSDVDKKTYMALKRCVFIPCSAAA